MVLDYLAASQNIVRIAYEADGHGIDTFFETDKNIFPIFFRKLVDMYFGGRQVESLVRADLAANNNSTVDVGRNNSFHTQFDSAVCEQNRMSLLHFIWQALVGNGRAMCISKNVVSRQDEFLTWLERHKTVGDDTDTDLRTL